MKMAPWSRAHDRKRTLQELVQRHNNRLEKDGPLICQGDITSLDDQESDVFLLDADHFRLCRCGGSKKNLETLSFVPKRCVTHEHFT
jgi:hypothetical protein